MKNGLTSPYPLPPPAEMIRAMQARDPAYEGVFFTAVTTTGIFCRPTCTAKKPKPENVAFFARADDALVAGYRPCKRCRPLELAANAPDWVADLLRQVMADPARQWTDEALLAQSIDSLRLRRWFKQHFGMTFHVWLRSWRLGLALESIQSGTSTDAAAFEQGYESLSGFRDAFQKHFASTPGRAGAKRLLRFTRLTTPLGPMLAMAEEHGLVLLEFIDRPALIHEIETLKQRYHYAVAPGPHAHLARIERELAEYFNGQRFEFEVPLQTPGTEFEGAVWAILRRLPYGKTTTYGDIARQLGKPAASRAVGMANGHNRLAIVVPCHRVIGADGSLTGYGGGQARKAFLLRLEQQAAARQGILNIACAEEYQKSLVSDDSPESA